MSEDSAKRFLVKTDGRVASRSLRLDGTPLGMASKAVPIKVEPLFASIGRAGLGMAATQAAAWQVVTAPPEAGAARDWDMCHLLVSQNAGVVLAEPDITQRWPIDDGDSTHGFGLREGGAHQQDIGNGYAGDTKDNYWFRDRDHGQFDAALAAIRTPEAGKRVRIAHLDTGYDPKHESKPAFLNADLARNFVDAAFPNDATDRSDGLANNFSHGCGTLSILAGAGAPGMRGFGCAPNAEIVPVRVANRVVLFENSAIARGFDYVHGLCADARTRVHVLSMSMGGLPSQAWVDAVNALYEAGVFVVTAAGNNVFNVPTHWIVYPARFDRVVAACGVMADSKPYANLPARRMAGNWGPSDKMVSAVAGYTPNVPWARFGGSALVDFDGNGTSAATPQVAGAAALWIEANRDIYDAYPESWMRVEAIRKALFEAAARPDPRYADELGRGLLRAADALTRRPDKIDLRKTPPDTVDFSFLKLLFGDTFGVTATVGGAPNAMLQLEAMQIAVSTGIETRMDLSTRQSRAHVIDELLARKDLSRMLRGALQRAAGTSTSAQQSATAQPQPKPEFTDQMREHFLNLARNPKVPDPPFRRLRIYAYDPGQQTRPDLFDVSVATVNVRWEPLEKGPIGEYIEVVDVDPASDCCYYPVDLSAPSLLAQNGLPPSEPNPQFHQQMVYAVAMGTIERFERALGRKALWGSRRTLDAEGKVDEEFVQRLRIYPHALREQNAYYNPDKIALLLGYFQATDDGDTVSRGDQIFAACSHDIIAHETTHALLDGLHARYSERTNIDMPAFHEAFADIVALFQHFAMPESLMRQIRRARGSLDIAENLGALARQFGEATGMHGALRRFVGKTGRDIAKVTDPDMDEPHKRGAVLVSAIFAAFTTIYTARCADLIRLATNGSGILPDGEISHDLSGRLAEEAAKIADQVLNMCIRALDYCPPVNLEFGDYIRALITADTDLVRDDDRGYRVAFINAFRDRGIKPSGLRHLGEDTLVWEPPAFDTDLSDRINGLVGELDVSWSMIGERRGAYDKSKKNAFCVDQWLNRPENRDLFEGFGLVDEDKNAVLTTPDGPLNGAIRRFQVYSVRPARRLLPDGTSKAHLIVELTQTFRPASSLERFRGGCTLIVDLADNSLKYVIRKKLLGLGTASNQIAARDAAVAAAADNITVYYPPGSPAQRANAFAMLHRCGRGA